MDKFKFTDDEAVDILNAVEELIENPRFTKTDFIDRI